MDYVNGVITFGTSTGGSVLYLTGRSYDMNQAAAEIWRHKASHYVAAYDVRTDNTSLSRSQLMAHCVKMADYYESLGGVSNTMIYRSDVEA